MLNSIKVTHSKPVCDEQTGFFFKKSHIFLKFPMLSKSEIQFFRNLRDRKSRQEHKLFMAEGEKLVEDLIDSGLKVRDILFTSKYEGSLKLHATAREIKEAEMERITAFKTPSPICAVFEIIETAEERAFIPQDEWILALDGISDPGNLGTLLRSAEWFGIFKVVCSADTVDAYNPKCVQASMGSVGRVKTLYTDLSAYLQSIPGFIPIFGADMTGQNIYTTHLPSTGILVLGSEGKGLSLQVRNKITSWISIPRNHKGARPESLNVAIAGSILISQLCSKQKA